MKHANLGEDKTFAAARPPEPNDADEAVRLIRALDALEISEADDPTERETYRLRRSVVDASLALERKQSRLRSR